jgi:CHAT domain-containing protein/tetratricopeptide (TPR) repeat protein
VNRLGTTHPSRGGSLRSLIHLSVSLLLPLVGVLAGQNTSLQQHLPPEPVGVAVERATRSFEAAKAGMRAGDILTHWSSGDHEGEIESPFDVFQIEVQEAYRGPVTFTGLRGSSRQVWILGPQDWGLVTRPAFPPHLQALYLQGQKLAAAGRVGSAQRQWRIAASLAFSAVPVSARVWLIARLADLLARSHRWKDADAAYQEATSQDLKAETKIILLRDWAETLAERYDWAGVEQRYQDLEAQIQRLNSGNMLAAHILNEMGETISLHSDLTKAEDYHREALDIQERVAPRSSELAASLNGMCEVFWNRGDLLKAKQYCDTALAMQKELSTTSLGFAWILDTRGLIFTSLGDLAAATKYHRQALAIEERLTPNSLSVAYTLILLAESFYGRGDLDEAAKDYRRALRIQERRAPSSLHVALSLTYLGRVAQARGHLVQAKRYFRRALAIRQRGDNKLDVAESFNDLGRIAQAQGDPRTAQRYYGRSLAIREKKIPGSLDVAECLNEFGSVSEITGDLEAAEEFYSRALAVREKAPETKDYADTLLAIAGIKLKRKHVDEASSFFERGLSALESQVRHLGGGEELRSNFRTRYATYYSDYLDLLVRQAKPEQAFQVLERSRAQTLLEVLAGAHIDIRNGVAPALLQQERSLAAALREKQGRRLQLLTGADSPPQVAVLDREIEDLLIRRRAVEEEVRVNSPGYAALTQPQVLSLKEVQQQLDKDTLLLAYSLGGKSSYVFAVTLDSLAVYRLPKRTELEAVARRAYREELSVNNPAAGRKATDALGSMLLGPLLESLNKKRLAIVADGALQYIPFTVLPISSHMLLGTEHEIVYLSSASTLALQRKENGNRTPPSKLVAVLADPVFDANDERVNHFESPRKSANHRVEVEHFYADQLTRAAADLGLTTQGRLRLLRLPGTRREANEIIAVARATESLKAVDFEASRSTATDPSLGQYRIVHFATHGLIDSRHPTLSGIVLSLVNEQGEPQNGFFGLEDIYNLKLSADLVVLSACETGLGKEIHGEGLASLVRGFMYAGAPRIVASLWSVPDRATAELMKRFYTAMLNEKLRPAAALREAQNRLAGDKRWSAPYYWAGFTLQGEWK